MSTGCQAVMPESVPLTHELVKISHTPEGEPIEPQPAIEETAEFNDEVMIQIAADRPRGTIRVRLAYAGPSTPILADDPWAERRGRHRYHLLAASDLRDQTRELRVVDFRRVYSLPLTFVRERAARTGERLRLLSPHREHLSQAFARYFMRVGRPQDIPPFR